MERIADTYAAPEEPSAGMNAADLAREVASPSARHTGSVSDSAGAAVTVLQPGDVFFTMGAGDVDKAGPMVLEMLGMMA